MQLIFLSLSPFSGHHRRLHVWHALWAFFSETVEEEDEWKEKGCRGKGCCGTNHMKLYLPTQWLLSDTTCRDIDWAEATVVARRWISPQGCGSVFFPTDFFRFWWHSLQKYYKKEKLIAKSFCATDFWVCAPLFLLHSDQNNHGLCFHAKCCIGNLHVAFLTPPSIVRTRYIFRCSYVYCYSIHTRA